jgi:biotin transporter BioY
MGSNAEGPPNRLVDLLGLLDRLGKVITGVIESRTAQVIAFERLELRRVARLFALSLVAAVLTCAAAGFAAVAVLAALGEVHRAMGSAIIAMAMIVLAIIAALLARGRR